MLHPAKRAARLSFCSRCVEVWPPATIPKIEMRLRAKVVGETAGRPPLRTSPHSESISPVSVMPASPSLGMYPANLGRYNEPVRQLMVYIHPARIGSAHEAFKKHPFTRHRPRGQCLLCGA